MVVDSYLDNKSELHTQAQEVGEYFCVKLPPS